jgi:hypothetical protein
MSSRSYLATGATIAGAALIVAATPAVLSAANHLPQTVPVTPVPVRAASTPYALTAVTLDDLIDAFYNGYGAKVTSSTTVNGISGVLYYLIDTELASNTDLDNYFFEVSPGYAVEQALYETFGTDSAVGQVVNAIWNPQAVASSAIIDAASSIFGSDSVVYNAVNYYFNGYEDTSAGVPSVVHYLLDTITGSTSSTSTSTETTESTTTASATTESATADSVTSASATSTTSTATTDSTDTSESTTATSKLATVAAMVTDAETVSSTTSDTDTATTPGAAATTTDTTTATTEAVETTDNPLVRVSKNFSPTLKSDDTTKSAKAVSSALKDHTFGDKSPKHGTSDSDGSSSSPAA